MSLTLQYKPQIEPYYDFFIRNGYKYLSHGYMHAVFEKDGLIYKVLRSAFGIDKDSKNFLFESSMLQFLGQYGLPTAKVVKVFNPNELIPNYSVLVEEKINGWVYSSNDLSVKHIKAILNTLNTTQNISLDCFGPLALPELQKANWHDYLKYMLDKAKNVQQILKLDIDIDGVQNFFQTTYVYDKPAKFLILDPNEKNYIFDKNDNLAGIIDIDHPIAFDPLYEMASFLYSRPRTFEIMINAGLISKSDIQIINNYGIVYSLFDTWFRYEKNNFVVDNRLNVYINRLLSFLHDKKR